MTWALLATYPVDFLVSFALQVIILANPSESPDFCRFTLQERMGNQFTKRNSSGSRESLSGKPGKGPGTRRRSESVRSEQGTSVDPVSIQTEDKPRQRSPGK